MKELENNKGGYMKRKRPGRKELLKTVPIMIDACQNETLATEFILRESGKPDIKVRISKYNEA